MMMNDGSAIRFDYVRVVCRVAPGYQGPWETRMMDNVPEEYRTDAATFRKHGKLGPMWDGKTKRATKAIELWGKAAHDFMRYLTPRDWVDVTRIDVRAEVPPPPMDIIPLLQEVQKIKSNARRTTKYIDSPIRTKEDGRDAGGCSLIVGAQGSRRRLCVYKRAKANWALEVQFGDKEPEHFATMVKDHIENSGKAINFFDDMLRVATQAYYDAALDLTGHTYGEFAHLEFWQIQDEIFTSQEETLAMVDELYNRLDPEGQAAFALAHLAPYTATYTVVETPSEVPPVEETAYYTDEELEHMERLHAQAELENGRDPERWEY